MLAAALALSALRVGCRGGGAAAGCGITAFVVLELVRAGETST